MPNNLTDDPTQFPGPIQVPAPGDPRTDTSVATPFQQLADRTANNAARLNSMSPFLQPGYSPALPAGVTVGAGGLLYANSTSALLGIPVTNRFDGMMCQVYGDALFQFEIGSSATVTAPFVYAPSDVGIGAGRWFRQGGGALGVANGLVQADSTARVPAAGVRNGLIAYQSATAAFASSTSSGYVIVPGTLLSFAGLLVGDVIEARYSVNISTLAVAGYSAAALVQAAGPGTSLPNPLSGSEMGILPATASVTGYGNASAVSTWTVPSGGAGTWTVGLYMTVTGGATANNAGYENANLVAQVIRP